MKTLLKLGLAAVALSACVTTLIARAGGKTQTLYAVTDLGPGSASKVSNPDASGTFLVVGSTPDPDGNELATVWTVSTDGTVDDVFTYGFPSLATDVNDHGMIVGISQNGAFNGAFVDVPGVGVEFLPGAQALGVNNEGVVVGNVSDPSGPQGVSGAVWYVDATGAITGPVLTTIGPGVTFLPSDINDEGTMCGFIFAPGSPINSAAIAEFDSDGQLQVQNLGVLNPGDTFSKAVSINSDGLVVGISSGSGVISAVLWDPSQPNTLTSLGDFGGGLSQAFDINDDGQVVGYSGTNAVNSALGFIWQNGQMVNLNKLLTSRRSHTVQIASGINNAGHIVGSLQSGNACVLTPQ